MTSINGLNGFQTVAPVVGHQTTTTQTPLSSMTFSALPRPLSAQLPPITVLSKSLANATSAGQPKLAVRTTSASDVKPSKGKCSVPHRTNGLFEGSHIHFSPVDNKPLCSYSTKLCKQRRINGYAFCIRHILEDPSAPFRQCKHVAKYNQQKCSNAIPANEDRDFCNSHMQIAGMAPKKERKEKNKDKALVNGQTTGSSGANANHNSISDSNQSKCVSSVNGFTVNTKDVNQLTDNKLTNFEAFIRPAVKVNGVKSTVNAHTLQKLNNNLQKKSLTIDKSCGTTAPLPPLPSTLLTNDSSLSSQTNSVFKLNSNSVKNNNFSKTNKSNESQKNVSREAKPKPKRKKKDKKSIEKFVLARKRKRTADGLFNYHIWSDTESEEEDDRQPSDPKPYQDSGDHLYPMISSLSADLTDLDVNELKNELLSQKFLLKNLIAVRKQDLAPQLDKTRSILKTLNSPPIRRFSYMDYKLMESRRRSEQSIRKGICCYSADETQEGRCRRPSLPFSRHCQRHILYNVDQCLFERCTAKCAQTMTQCSRPTFDFLNEDPLCDHHQRYGTEIDERTLSQTTDAKKRKKSKPMALTRVSRRGKKGAKKKKGPNGTEIPVVEDSIESRLSVASIDSDSVNSHSSTDITINLLAQQIDHNIQTTTTTSADIVTHQSHIRAISPLNTTFTNASIHSLPQTTTSAVSLAPAMVAPHDLPLMRLPPLMSPQTGQPCPPVVTTGCEPPIISMVPPIVSMVPPVNHVVLDHINHSMPPPPPLEPTEEALVASIVADLPQLTTDADFTEVLNKIPDDFSDFLLEHPNGDMPTTEETEALEQALAMVNKDVQNLVMGMNGQSTGEFGDFSNWLGSLTSEQRQQLNGLIDGAIASSTSLSPILKNASDAYPSMHSALPTTAPPLMKNSSVANSYVNAVHSQVNSVHSYPSVYHQPLAGHPQQQEFVPISAPVPTLLNSNLLMNGLSSHPS